jgi:adenylate cyclase
VAGRKKSIDIYEVIAPLGGLSSTYAQAVNFYERGLRHYRDKDFSGALIRFEAALKSKPDDGPSLTLANRCREYLTDPPAKDWDGVTAFNWK